MNRGLIEKAFREVWGLTLILGGAMFLIEVLLAYVIPTFGDQMAGFWGQIQFLQDLLAALLGAEIGETIGPHVFQAIPWVHPIPLAIIWAHELTFCTRLPVGEIDRGTIDVLLALPVSRWQVYLSETLVFLLTGVVLLGMGLIGNYVGGALAGTSTLPTAGQIAAVLANGFCLYLAVGAVIYLFSSLSERRGRAVGLGLAVVMTSFLVSFLARFWEPAESLSFLSVLSYYRPMLVFQNGDWPFAHMAVLVVVAGFFWVLAGAILDRRDICTV